MRDTRLKRLVAIVIGATLGLLLVPLIQAVRMATPELVVAIPALLIYFSPALTASRRRHPHADSICVVNLFLGWTFVGWVIAMAWAMMAIEPTTTAPGGSR